MATEAEDKGVALLYSGGSDSSLAACLLAQRFPKVYLNTFMRFGFMATGFSSVHYERMEKRFPGTQFTHSIIPASRFYSELEGHGYFSSLREYGFMAFASCGHCKVALHWRNLLFCLERGVKFAADGAVVDAEEFAEQNPRILMPELKDFYGHFGIELLHPVYQKGLSTEEMLYDLGISDQPRIKRTTKDNQVICSQQIGFAMFLRTYLRNRSFAEYEKRYRQYLSGKLAHLRALTEEYVKDPGGDTRIGRLLR
ncbi:MAG: hypothetical protein ABIJ96_08960 [Elusimicrobiota bacterium]